MESALPNRKQSTELPPLDFQALFESTPAALLVMLPDDPTFTILAVSDLYARIAGIKRNEIIGRGLFEVFPDNPEDPTASGVRNLRASLRRAIATCVADRIPHQRYDVARPVAEGRGFEERYWSALNTPVCGADGKVTCLLHSVEEISDKVRAQKREHLVTAELSRSEKRFRQLAETSTLGLLIAELKGGISYLNPRVRELLGYTEEDVAAGLVRWDRLAPPEFAALDAEAAEQLATTGRCAPYETVYLTKDGTRVPVLVAASALEALNGSGELAAFILDLRERKKTERDAFLVRLDDATRPLVQPEEIMATGAHLLTEHLGCDRCAYATVDEDGETLHVTRDYTRPGFVTMVGRHALSMFGQDAARAIRSNLPVVEEDIEKNPHAADVLPVYRQAKIRSYIAVPLFKAGKLVSAVAVHQQTVRRWLPEEVELVQLVANRWWESIERAHVAQELQESERRLRLAQRAARIGSFEWLMNEDRVIWTPELEALYGVPDGTFEGHLHDWSKRVVAEDAERVIAEIGNCLEKQQTEYAYEFRAVLPNGTRRWLRGQAQFFYDDTGAPERMIGVNIDIDGRKQAEAHLHQQWHTFDTVLSHIPDFAYTFDLEGRFTYINRALLALWQKPLEEALGKNFYELDYPPELARHLQRQIQEVIHSKQPVRDQTPYTAPSGETGFYEFIFVPVLGENGRVEAVAGSARDITARNQAEELVEQDRRRWRELLLRAPAAIAVLRGPEHRFEWINEDFVRLVRRNEEAIVGKAASDAVPELASQGYVSMLDRVFQTGEAHVAHEAPARLGEEVPEDVYLNFVCLPTRNSYGLIDGTFVHATDVTDLVRARKHVEDSEQQFRSLAETIPHLAWVADHTGHIFWYNQRWYDYTGTTFEEIEGWGWQKVHDPAVLPSVLAKWKIAIESGEPFEMVFPLRSADGTFRSFLTRVEPVKDNRGYAVRWFGTNTDITQQQKTEGDLRRMNRELEEFAYVASHDLQEPLRMVNIYTHLILKRVGEADETMNQFAGFVRQGVTRMQALIQDLLTFSRIVHDEEQRFGTADLSASFGEALSVLRSRIEESGAQITAESLPIVRGETTQIAQVFQNLLSNALKYRKKDVRPEIHISAKLDGDQWIVSVRDNGIGFEPQYAERIFGLFKRLHKEEYPGTGLGLAICRRIMERYGGRIWAESRPGEGTTFYFSLPRVEGQ